MSAKDESEVLKKAAWSPSCVQKAKATVLEIIREQVLWSFLIPSKVKSFKALQPTDESKTLVRNTPATRGEMRANGCIFKSEPFDHNLSST